MNNARSRTKRLDGIIMGEDEVRKMWMRKEEELRRKKAGRRLDELEVSGIDAFPQTLVLQPIQGKRGHSS